MSVPPRVYGRIHATDHALGHCSVPHDWIGRESGYADFVVDHSILPHCPPFPIPSNRHSDSRNRNIALPQACAQQSTHADLNIERYSDSANPLQCNVQPEPPVQAPMPTDMSVERYAVGSTCVLPPMREVEQSHCSNANDCTLNAMGPPRNCQQGPVDVEDLALYFDSDKSQTGCATNAPRGNRAANPSQATHLRRSRPKYEHSAVAGKQLSGFQDAPRQRVELGCGDWGDGCVEQFCNDCPELFNFCTEERWLQCPASDRCPLYVTYPYVSSAVPPCLYENLQSEYAGDWSYGYNEDDQLLEDYLSNEKRKERSRDAARFRRSKETDIFIELASALPIPPEQAAHLDKASVMRLAIAYLKVRAVVDSIPVPPAKSESSVEMDELFPKALSGFMLVLSGDGNIVYLSENVSDYLGVSQMDMMGQSVYEYSHPCDHDELRECLSSKPHENSDKRACSFFLRFKCTLTSKGRKVNLKSASYKVIHCIGRLTYIRDSNSNSMEIDDEERKEDDVATERGTDAALVLVGCPIPHPSNIEIPLGRHTFLSKHSLSMKFTYADEKLAEYLGWKSEELVGQSVFEFYHALDNLALDKSFKSLFSKGQCETLAYRFLGKRGGYAWVVTQATLIHCSKQQKPLSVVCVNYIISGIEREDEVFSARQLAARDSTSANDVKAEKVTPAISPLETPKVQLQARVEDTEGIHEEAAFESVEQTLPVAQKEESDERAKPLAVVTTSTFRAAGPEERRKDPRAQDGSRKDKTFPSPVHVTEKAFVGARAPKESLKENDAAQRKTQDRRQPAGRAPFIFQGKPAVEYDPESAIRRDRPQAVTRHLFAPLSVTTQQQQPQQQQQQEQVPCRPPPQTTTASIFAPRTEDMNKGFLTFSEDHPGLTMLKDEPEDLTHLAPTPGDVCVPLEDTPFLSDMLDEFILGNDNYCPLLSPGGALPPELRSADFGDPLKDTDLTDTARSKSLGESLADSDPFMYGDSPGSPCSIDPNTVSPSLVKYRQSPERSIDSLGSPTGGSGGEGLSEDEMLMLGIGDSIADDELALRAPYIPMSDQDEALELLISDDMVMWGPSQTTEKGSPKWLADEREQRTSDSSLAQLLRTDQAVSRRYNDHGGGLVNPAQVLGQVPRKNASLDSSRWSVKQERADRPTKRIHTAPLDPVNENKRIKCDDQFERPISLTLEEHLQLGKLSASRRSPSVANSQLLRRLVSQQTVLRNNYPSDALEGVVEPRHSSNALGNRIRDLSRVDVELEADGDGDEGGGGEAGGGRSSGVGNNDDTTCPTATQRNDPPCSSVLMNLLVSGCDDPLLNSRNVPSLLPKSLTTPLSVNLDNQMVPQCQDSGSSMSFDHLSPDTRRHLGNGFMSGGTIVSPSSPMMSFESFDYDPSVAGSGLLQVQSDLFGTLLDRNLV